MSSGYSLFNCIFTHCFPKGIRSTNHLSFTDLADSSRCCVVTVIIMKSTSVKSEPERDQPTAVQQRLWAQWNCCRPGKSETRQKAKIKQNTVYMMFWFMTILPAVLIYIPPNQCYKYKTGTPGHNVFQPLLKWV